MWTGYGGNTKERQWRLCKEEESISRVVNICVLKLKIEILLKKKEKVFQIEGIECEQSRDYMTGNVGLCMRL